MQTIDNNMDTLQHLYNSAERIFQSYSKILFLEACYYHHLAPKGLKLFKKANSTRGDVLQRRWDGVLADTTRVLTKISIEEEIVGMNIDEEQFWSGIDLIRSVNDDDVSITAEWLSKIKIHLMRLETKLLNQKSRKLRDLTIIHERDDGDVVERRFISRMEDFPFRERLWKLCEDYYPEVNDIVTLINLNESIEKTKGYIFDEDVDSDSSVREGEVLDPTPTGISNNGGVNSETDRLEGNFVSKNVVNLSKRTLTQAEISLLSKGLKFIPTPNSINIAKIKENLEVFGRKLRLKWHFREQENHSPIDPFVEKSKFNPKGDAMIEVYMSCLEEKILEMADSFKPTFKNLTKEEKEALDRLQNDTSIVIKEADKGSAVVVWDREDYVKEANSQLQDKNVYEETSFEADFLSDKIFQTLNKMKLKEEITSKNVDYFLINNPRLARFYLLPKIHKRLTNVPGRPVVSHVGFHTERISSFIDYHLQPLAQNVKSYIKDTNDFLSKLKKLKNLPDGAIMVTVDVVGLYPSIPHDEGLAAMKAALDRRAKKDVSTESLCELAEIVLKNNIFEFDEKIYRQLRGTAIGTKMAPPYAILFLAELEEAFLAKCKYKPEVWLRYIDDIFMIWTHGEEKLKEFLAELNSFHDTIKFTAESSKDTVNFLDVKVSLKNGIFSTDLYVKPTDTHQFLHPASCHPFHCKKAIPFSQALRLNRICSNDDDFENRCEDLYDWLRERGYKHKLVEDQIKRACEFDRDELLTKPKPPRKNVVSLNIEYHPAFSKLSGVLKELDCVLQGDENHKKVFSDTPLVGFSNGKSLKNILVRAVLPKQNSPKSELGSKKCGKSKCEVCKNVVSTNQFKSKTTGENFEIKKGPIDCDTKNVIYLVTCKVCGIQNVGSTKDKYRERFNNYKSVQRKVREKVLGEKRPETKRGRPRLNSQPQATEPKKTVKKYAQEKFHQHFCTEGHQGIPDWEITLIDTAFSEKSLRSKELFWQYKIKSFHPDGLNEYEAPVDTT